MSELVEHRAQLGAHVIRLGGLTEEIFTFREMPVAKCFNTAESTDEVAFRGLLPNRKQGVGGAAECRYDDDWRAIEPSADDLGGALYRIGITDRRSAEFDDDHALPSRPVAGSSSAFNTDPPAAPRIVLWPIAIILMSRIGSSRTRPT